MSARAAGRGGGASLLWGLFAASSWAWCIGLFLPVVLRRLMGWPGFLAFAIPNVLGCAAFGFVLDRRRSRRLVRRHRGAMVVFSGVTIAYQLLLAGWTGRIAIGESLTPALGGVGPWAGAGVGVLTVLVVAAAVASTRDRAIAWIAVAAWAFSVVGLLVAWSHRPPAAALDPESYAPELASSEIWWLLPTLLLGFLLCPYLDLTFHRALRRGPRKPTFTIFGVAFATLIVLVALLANPAAYQASGIGMTLLPILLAQMWVQLGFTGGAHVREIASVLRRGDGVRRATPVVVAALAAGVLLGTPLVADEANYLRMLGWYGLIFPAYVMVAMVGLRRGPDAATWWLVGGAALVGLPFMEIGISGREFAWTAAGAAAVLVAGATAMGLRSSPGRG